MPSDSEWDRLVDGRVRVRRLVIGIEFGVGRTSRCGLVILIGLKQDFILVLRRIALRQYTSAITDRFLPRRIEESHGL